MSETTTASSPSKSIEDLKELLREAEGALGSTADGENDEIQALRERLRAALDDGQNRIAHLAASARRKVARADAKIRANPYQTIGIATGIGLLTGFLLCRSRRSDG